MTKIGHFHVGATEKNIAQLLRTRYNKRNMKKQVRLGIKTKRNKNSDGEYFDDCYVCQMTKKAEEEGKDLSVEELQEIFRKANEQN